LNKVMQKIRIMICVSTSKTNKGTFKYHMTLREGFAQTVRVPSYEWKWGLAKSSYNFHWAKKV